MRLYSARIWYSIVVILLFGSCAPTSYEESVEFRDLAEITSFSVPDSASSNNIPVHIFAIVGRTTASSFWELGYQRTDSLFEFAVYGKRVLKAGVRYDSVDVVVDTTLMLVTNPPRKGLHFFRIYGYPNTIITDSSRLY